jgi:hypothetical protein
MLYSMPLCPYYCQRGWQTEQRAEREERAERAEREESEEREEREEREAGGRQRPHQTAATHTCASQLPHLYIIYIYIYIYIDIAAASR